MEIVVKDTHFFTYTELGQRLPVIQFSVLEQTDIRSEYSVVKYCITLHDELHLVVIF